MFAIVALVVYGTAISILGLITLSCVRRLRVSGVNLLVFVLGGFLGMFALANVAGWGVEHLMRYLGIRGELFPHSEVLGYLAVLAGIILGGWGSVWLKELVADKSLGIHRDR